MPDNKIDNKRKKAERHKRRLAKFAARHEDAMERIRAKKRVKRAEKLEAIKLAKKRKEKK